MEGQDSIFDIAKSESQITKFSKIKLGNIESELLLNEARLVLAMDNIYPVVDQKLDSEAKQLSMLLTEVGSLDLAIQLG